jgi:parallel beta-helix repeat protein
MLALVALMAVSCASLGVLVGLGVVHPRVQRPSWWPEAIASQFPVQASQAGPDPAAGVIGPVDPASAGHLEKAPPRRPHSRLIPTQYAAVSNPRSLRGTPWANIAVFPDHIQTMVGARITWIGYFRQLPGFDGSITLDKLATLIARSRARDWLRETEPGVFLLKVGLVEAPGTVLTVAAPRVKALHMLVAPYVYVTGLSATAAFRAVTVTSWNPQTNSPDTDATHDRPFISVRGPGARLDLTDSQLGYLGQDISGGYGVSWTSGATGQALRSVFHDNLFGAYTRNAVGVSFLNDVFRDNARYGLDPHTNSRNLTITNNEAYGNNTHGIIFSQGVTGSVIANNHSHDNGANGIMMDELSNNNVIADNVSEHNAGAGIVLQGSSSNRVSGNVVAANPIGIRVNANARGVAVANQVIGNQLSGNGTGIKVYNNTSNTSLVNNTIRGTRGTALALMDPVVSQSDIVIGAQKAVVTSRAVSTLRALSAREVTEGVVVGGGSTAVVDGASIDATTVGLLVHPNAALALGNTPTTIERARKAVLISGTANLNNLTLRNVIKGVVLTSSARVAIDTSQLVAAQVGLEVQGLGGTERIRMARTTVRAPNPVAGATLAETDGNQIIMTLSWLAISGAFFVTLALALYLLHRIWSPHSTARNPSHPPHHYDQSATGPFTFTATHR